MANGICFNCLSNADCGTGNAWGGDMGASLQCNTVTGICFNCNANANGGNPQGGCPAGQNCQTDGTCVPCTTSPNTCANDGGSPSGQTVCDTTSGICGSPCTGNFGASTSNDCLASAGNCDKDGVCRSCTSGGYPGCMTNDGPPPMGSNTLCDAPTGICINPYNCMSAMNIGLPGGQGGCPAGQNCQQDGSCIVCTAATCAGLDGGATPNQPSCDTVTGLCGPCDGNVNQGSASPCPKALPNCQADGSCISCSADSQCAILDGPPAPNPTPSQPFCDTQVNICVSYCTSDSDCTDPCLPHCAVNKGCCVECTVNADCPHTSTSNGGLAWRGLDATRTVCEFGTYMCVPPPPGGASGCAADADCAIAGKKACSTSQGSCVPCLFDIHCSAPTPACNTGRQVCVTCTSNVHCPSGQNCVGGACKNGASSVVIGLVSIFATLLFLLVR